MISDRDCSSCRGKKFYGHLFGLLPSGVAADHISCITDYIECVEKVFYFFPLKLAQIVNQDFAAALAKTSFGWKT